MSLRYMISRVGARAAQAARPVKDRAQQQSASSMARTTGRATPATAQTAESGTGRAGSGAMARKAAEEENRRRAAAAEESLRTVMFLSMWGPNT